MARTYIEYRKLLQSLLPTGRFWTRAETSDMTKLLNAFGEELSRVEGRSLDLIYEAVPSHATETLEEWEADYNLPDEGYEIESTTDGRRAVIKSKFVAVGQQDKGYFIDIASALGYTVTITEFPKCLAGLATAGGSSATDEKCVFYWFIDIDVSAAMTEFYTLANISQLITDTTKRSPAHTILLFRFTGIGFSNGFSQGFDSVPFYDGSSWPIGYDRGFSNGFANCSDYDGVILTGGFSNGFEQGFDSYRGGGFDFNGFDNGFLKPS